MKPRKPLRRTPLKRKPITKPSVDTLMKKGVVYRASTIDPKPRKRIKPRSARATYWWDVALEIWAERPHVCEVCFRELGDEPIPIYFSHLLPRGSYRKYKRDKRNIRTKCGKCHTQWHDFGPEALQEHPLWVNICKLYFELRDEANGLTNNER